LQSAWWQEFLQRVGHAVRVHHGPAPSGDGGFIWCGAEGWFYDDTLQVWKVLDTGKLSPDAAELARFLIERMLAEAGVRAEQVLFRLAKGEYEQRPADFLKEAREAGLLDEGPAALACVQMWGDEVADALHVMRHVLADHEGAVVSEAGAGDYRVFFPLPPGRDAEQILEREAHAWLDTLSSELYLEGAIGWGTPCRTIRDLPRAEKEARFALAAGLQFLPRERVYRYDRLGFVKLLAGISPEMREEFLREVLSAETYAQLTGEMCETVYAFMANGANIAETARALFLHRNSLVYRLDKIKEITGLDLRNLQEAVTLWVALQLYQAQGDRAGSPKGPA
jgi:hypothetical protein